MTRVDAGRSAVSGWDGTWLAGGEWLCGVAGVVGLAWQFCMRVGEARVFWMRGEQSDGW